MKKVEAIIRKTKFDEVKEALNEADWKVHQKYLSKRNREGENNAWTP